ncbi:MAG: efflux RND transporter periplasmic adaptor subunit [Polyangiales bacterium]
MTQEAAPDFGLEAPRRRPWRVVAIVAVVVLVAVGVYLRRRPAAKPIQYVTAAASVGDVQETVETSGTVQPMVQVQVGSQVSGRLARVLVDFNHHVHRGQVLAEIDPAPFRAAVAQARAQVLSGQAQLQRAQANERLTATSLRRAQELRTRDLNAPSDVDSARGAHEVALADVAVARASIASAQASLLRAETDLGNTRILAPIDGVVIQRSIDEGQTVAASFQAPVLFILAQDLTRMRIIANVDEADIARLREHLIAEARVDAFPGEVFRGEVTEVRYGSTTTSGVVTYPTVVVVENPALKLRPGMTATVTVTSQRHTGVLRVPNAALRYQPGAFSGDGGTPGATTTRRTVGADGVRHGTVHLLRNGRPTPVDVTVGIVDETLTEVTGAGLSAGVQVVTDEIELTPANAAARGMPGGRSPR